MCTCIYCVFVLFLYVYLFSFVLSVLVQGLLPPSDNYIVVNNNNNNMIMMMMMMMKEAGSSRNVCVSICLYGVTTQNKAIFIAVLHHIIQLYVRVIRCTQ